MQNLTSSEMSVKISILNFPNISDISRDGEVVSRPDYSREDRMNKFITYIIKSDSINKYRGMEK